MNKREAIQAMANGSEVAPEEPGVHGYFVMDAYGNTINRNGECVNFNDWTDDGWVICGGSAATRPQYCKGCESVATACSECVCGDNWTGQPDKPIQASQHLRAAADIIDQRGKMRDSEEGERSFEKAAAIFNEIYPGEMKMDAKSVINVLMCVKLARASQGVWHLDDYTDLLGYTALLMEEVEGAR